MVVKIYDSDKKKWDKRDMISFASRIKVSNHNIVNVICILE